MSIFVRMKRSVIALALIAGALVSVSGQALARPAAGDTTLGDITGFSADQATYTVTAGTAKVRVVFLKDDVFRLWLAPDVPVKLREREVPLRMRNGLVARLERRRVDVLDLARWYVRDVIPEWVQARVASARARVRRA